MTRATTAETGWRSGYLLTTRQEEVLELVSVGWTNEYIAHRLVITQRSVAKHLEDIYERLEVSNRAAAAAWWGRVTG